MRQPTSIDAAIAAPDSLTNLDLIGLWMLKAELLHLDLQDEAAFAIFETHITPLLASAPDEVAVIVGYNQSDVTFATFKSNDFYGLVDHSRIAGIKLWQNDRLFHAQNSAASGKHYESLPELWRELRRTYLQGCWGPYRFVSSHMARECLQLGLPQEAAFHAMMSREEDVLKEVGEVLLRFGSPDAIQKALGQIIHHGQLRRLFVAACQILSQLVDAIPDAMVERVFVCLLDQAQHSPLDHSERKCVETAWETLAEIGFRLNDDQSRRLAQAAVSHPSWSAEPDQPNQVIPVRKTMLESICNSATAMKPSTAKQVADDVLPLATDRKRNFDYIEAINTLCQLARRGGSTLKKRLRKALYPSGQRLTHPLMQVAPLFEQPLTKVKLLSKDAESIAANIRLQVQRVPLDQEPQTVLGTFSTYCSSNDSRKIVVSMTDVLALVSILKHRAALSRRVFEALIDAVLAMIEEPENFLSNKTQLVKSIACVGDACSRAVARQVFDVLAPIARGQIQEPTCTMTAAEAASPLNPFRFGTGKPSELRAMCLYSLSCIERAKPRVFGKRLDELIELGLQDLDPIVRSFSLAAAREASAVSSSVFTAVLLATRDQNAKVVCAAFDAIATKLSDQQSVSTWGLVLNSLVLASQSPDVGVRRSASWTTSRLIRQAPNSVLRNQLMTLQRQFTTDRCYSVRRASRRLPTPD